MYVTQFSAVEHSENWKCPQCTHENDKSRLLCAFGDCDYVHMVTGKAPGDHTNYEDLPLNVQRELLFHGFIKQFYSSMNNGNFPKDVIGLIDQYFPAKLIWDRSKHGKNVQITSYDTAQHALPNDYSASGGIAVAASVIDSKSYERYSWQIRLSQCGYPIYVGFIVLPISECMDWNVNEFGSGGAENRNQIGIYCYEGQNGIYRTSSIGKARSHRMMWSPPRAKKSVIRGGRFRFEVDFKQKTCFVYYADEVIMDRQHEKINLYPTHQELQANIRIVPAALLCRGASYVIQEVHDDEK